MTSRVYVTVEGELEAYCNHCTDVKAAVIVLGGTDEAICEDCLKGLLAKLRDATPACPQCQLIHAASVPCLHYVEDIFEVWATDENNRCSYWG